MIDRENVIANLQILRTWAAVNPKYGMGLSSEDCEKAVGWLDEALDLLQAQEAHLMTWYEVWEYKPFHAWVEDKNTGAILFPIAFIEGEYRDVSLDWCLEQTTENMLEYGVTYRLWTGKPTRKQMEETPWNEK